MLYLGGGGSDEDEGQLWDLAFHSGQRVTVWPFAAPPSKISGVVKWMTGALAKRGEYIVEIGDRAPDFGLASTNVLAIPGGNTFDLLAWVQGRDLETMVKQFIARGGKIYGGSAGAILLGADIAICDVKTGGLDENHIGLENTKGFDLLDGAVVFPHFDPGSDAHAITCRKWADEHSVTVIATPEKSGVVVDGGQGFLNAGPDAVTVFAPHKTPSNHNAGTRFSI